MIYCSPEPGLLILDGLASYETQKAFSVVDALIMHKSQIVKIGARIPVTAGYLACVYSSLGHVPINNPPLASELRKYIVSILVQQTVPAFLPTGVTDAQTEPDITSPWIKDEVKKLWLDCLIAALLETIDPKTRAQKHSELVLATWQRENLPFDVTLTSDQMRSYLEVEYNTWLMPLLAHEHDWAAVIASQVDWPWGLDKLIEAYARRFLGIPVQELTNRREIHFVKPCLVGLYPFAIDEKAG